MDTREAGRKGGRSRSKKLSAKQRSESARKASIARWKKAKKRGALTVPAAPRATM